MPSVTVVVPAGGTGTRLGTRLPKQFLALGGLPLLAVTVRRLARHPAVGAIVVAVPAAHVTRARRLLGARAGRAAVTVVAGGATRQDSVWLALSADAAATADLVAVHDAVRPFVTRALLEAVLVAAQATGAAICALPVRETVKRVEDGLVAATIDRTALVAVQTPQAFRGALLREAHEKARRDGVMGTDDAMLVERLGHRIAVVPGLEDNVKITTPADLRWARGRVAAPRRRQRRRRR